MPFAIQHQRAKARTSRLTQISLATSIVLAGLAAPVQAVEIDTGNEDLVVRWDNAVRYNLGVRAEDVNSDFANASGTDATELRVKQGGVIMNRLDLLSEVDVVYKGKLGARISAAAWNDFSMSDRATGNPTLTAATEYFNNDYNAYAKRFNKGPSGEILDAFVFGTFDIGSVPVNVKLGKHVTYWGEGLFNLFHAISYSQAPLNLQKATSSPGIDAKEVFAPINQLSAQAQLTRDFSIGAQVMLDWKASRLPSGGTYFGGADSVRADRVNGLFAVGADIEPGKKSGQYGLNLRWSPSELGGSVGGYYRKFNEVMPWGLLNFSTRQLNFAFAENTELVGVSFSQNVAGINVGTEFSYRKNTALNSGAFTFSPTDKAGEGARGNTQHFLVNGIYLLPETALFRGGSLTGEFVYSRLDKVTSNAALFNGVGTAQCAGVAGGAAAARGISEVNRGCVTKDYYGIQVNASFDYPQALPGVNVSIPMSVSYGLKGNAAIPGGGNEGAVNWSVGVDANIRNVHRVSLKYNDSRARYTNIGSAAIPNTVANGGAINNDHGWISLTYKTSF